MRDPLPMGLSSRLDHLESDHGNDLPSYWQREAFTTFAYADSLALTLRFADGESQQISPFELRRRWKDELTALDLRICTSE